MKRQYLSLLREYLQLFPCVVIVGARQTGKSTLIQMLGDGRSIFDLDKAADFDQIANDPDLFFKLNKQPIAIDEAQQLPVLFPALRVAIDKNRQQMGQYLLSGSSSPALLTQISESLAGRVAIIEIAPLSLAEIVADHCGSNKDSYLLRLFSDKHSITEMLRLGSKSKIYQFAEQKIDNYWLYGGYPEPWIKGNSRFTDIWQEQYVKTYIERDVAQLFPQINSLRFRQFVEILASYSGSIINYSNISRILDVSQPTVKDYFKIAHGTFIWRNLQPYSKNVSKRIIKHPKGYFRDSGLLHHILQISSNRKLWSNPQMGNSWEGMVIEEILRQLNAKAIEYRAYYYRTSAGAEVDLVIESQFGLIPFEIKHSQNVRARNLRAIKDFIVEFGCPFGIVVNRDDKVRQLDKKILAVPFSVLVAD